MKRSAILLSIALVVVLALQQCKPDPVICEGDCEEPDSLYIGTPLTITAPFKFPPVKLPAGMVLTKEGVQLGRMLFYDPVLSSDSSISCASCHKQEFAFADGGKAKSQNIFGPTKRNSPPIFNMVWSTKYFWDGRSSTITAQAIDALHGEQNFIEPNVAPKLQAKPVYVALFKKAFGKSWAINENNVANALGQFMFTLVSSESRFDSVMRGQKQFTAEESRGFYTLFTKDPTLTAPFGVGADCFHCHSNTSFNYLDMTDNSFNNNGLDAGTNYVYPDNGLGEITGNQLQNGLFKTPHIRNIEVTGPYMHDGRFATLEEVVNFYNEGLHNAPNVSSNLKFAAQGGLHTLTAQDKADLILFLKTLTDHRFLTDTAFSNPFK